MYKVGVIIFPGSNCVAETVQFLQQYPKRWEFSQSITISNIWHKEPRFRNHDMFILPGGFSYGDYLRPGKLASMSPALDRIVEYAEQGTKILGICNGFQILCEMGLLPGTLRCNNNLQFICKDTTIYHDEQEFSIPVAHGAGNYYHPKPYLVNVAYRYRNNPNGSADSIAGIYNTQGNILGMMPHPERAFKSYHRSQDGYKIFTNFITK